jgi:hypothetical protein
MIACTFTLFLYTATTHTLISCLLSRHNLSPHIRDVRLEQETASIHGVRRDDNCWSERRE